MSTSLRSIAIRSAALALGGASVFVMSPARSAEPAPAPDNGFTCRASAVRTELSSVALLNQEPFTANEEGGVCKTEDAGVVGGQPVDVAGLGTVDVLFARTNAESNTAESGVAKVDLDVAGVPITAEVLTSTASAGTCPSPALSGSSEILNVNAAGVPVEVPSQSDDVPDAGVPGVVDVHVGYQTIENGVVTQRALFVDVNQGDPTLAAVPDVIVAEAIADIHGEPCAPPVVDEGRCPAPSPEGKDGTPDKDCGQGQPSDVTKNPRPKKG